jgi:hypothetical protein
LFRQIRALLQGEGSRLGPHRFECILKGRFRKPPEGRVRRVIAPFFLCPEPFATDLLHVVVTQVERRGAGVIDDLQHLHPSRPLVTETLDDFADGGVILLFDMAIVVFVGRAAREKRTPWRRRQRSTGLLINSLPVSEWTPSNPMGMAVKAWSMAITTQEEALFMRAKWTVQPVFTPVMVRV